MTKEEAIELLYDIQTDAVYNVLSSEKEALDMAIKALEQQPCEDKGEISDGYHTFNQLYHQRAILFATIVNQNKDKAWKSFKHSDGKYCFDSDGEWFIVGVDTPQGSYTYHYSKEYWDMFNCQELECGKEWDGHTEEDVIRLLSLEQEPCEDCISREAVDEYITNLLSGYLYDEERTRLEDLTAFVWELPSVTPTRPTARWEKLVEDYNKCSKCGEMGKLYHIYKYCPNCGSEMTELNRVKTELKEMEGEDD